MGKDTRGPAPSIISEPWLMEWVEKGIADLGTLLASYARFDLWLAEHPREETP